MPVVQAVHAAGGRIFCQLWHMGRLVHPSFLDGEAPVSSSATIAPYKAHTYDGRQPYTEARALTVEEIAGVVDEYARAAAHATAAGFDGVQIHGANGYLIDQFLRDGTNSRDDDYGGSVENRIRLLGEVTRAVAGMSGRSVPPSASPPTAIRRAPMTATRTASSGRRGDAERHRHRLPGTARAAAGRHVRQGRGGAGRARDPQGVCGPLGAQLGL
jgi:2,4-dienoyl-CoA reductase-like NADH-dependent reductase (Old Yellow Enzyme family)